MIRILIADDEPLARRRIRSLLDNQPDCCVVAESADGRNALENIEVLRPDAVFLDMQMPNLSVMDLLRTKTSFTSPYTIITTAYDHYALQAFEVSAIDYLMKPIEEIRFNAALLRLRQRMDRDMRADGRVDIEALVKQVTGRTFEPARPAPSDRIPIKIGRRVRFLSAVHVRYVTADGNFVNLHMTTGEIIHTSERISQMEEKLFAHQFLRIHRSYIVNIEQIREIRSMGSYYEFVMTGTECLTSGLTYKKNIQCLLAAWRQTKYTRVN
jgi:two-component system LytT family response regulator